MKLYFSAFASVLERTTSNFFDLAHWVLSCGVPVIAGAGRSVVETVRHVTGMEFDVYKVRGTA